ncbi:pullulanase-type alpha-1,6-glucosidase [Pseudoduganella chitinolytica]|uniref:Pullulanase-type alpha-1,6-glucosidase n=1 Tax=Pseudoduganella chitinolytica TaxID=34070 RepID=A0ABY8BBG1_9BURK|nr:pullulanase-type alpha-1,6-glucosidase [Pseudoduganella chitinolytica]WEF33041.1 pullulanase-type alpha-1,6-glucosidase [Pseudoduganella chitinolytica]
MVIRKSTGAAVAACLLVSTAPARAAADLATCNTDGFQAVLSPAASAYDARAAWLDRRSLAWPGAAPDAIYRLYHSATSAIVARSGAPVRGADGGLALKPTPAAIPAAFAWLGKGPVLALNPQDEARMAALHKGQLVLVREDAQGNVLASTEVQSAGALDDLYAGAERVPDLGATPARRSTTFKLWAPTAGNVAVCTYDSGSGRARAVTPLRFDSATGVWSATLPANLDGKYYRYAVDVYANGSGIVRNLVTDPYAVSLTTDSRRAYIADLAAPRLKPAGWDHSRAPAKVLAQTDMSIYELHVRDFSVNDASVTAANRGKYTAFTERDSNGMRHLAALARAGLTDVHLLPVYDIGSVPEAHCDVPDAARLRGLPPDSDVQQQLVGLTRQTDCYNWGYDPYHYSAPEGSYSTDPADGARRIVELRQMVMALHGIGLRVGMDVVYNHTFLGGQAGKSVLDRIVPGYYHRLDATGAIERSTCCDNTATEHRMMGKLMTDSVELWTKHYRIDSFRFDLMGHQPRATMEALQRRVDAAAGRHVNLIGEGWNFGEVANGARFVQASQLALNGSGIGTFSDRGRDAVRGGGAGDAGRDMVARQGYVNGLSYDPNGSAAATRDDLLKAADLVRVGLAGSVRTYPLTTRDGTVRKLEELDYAGQPAGYASAPGETVNYVENHDNQTLYDLNALRLPLATATADRARVQMLAAAINAFSQGVAYFHAGFDILRSKSLDRNSFDSGDWFNRLDWTYRDNYFGTGLPPAADNGKDYALLRPLLANPALKPAPADIAFARDTFRDLLAIRAGSTLFRLRTADEIAERLRFYNTGPDQVATVIVGRLDGSGYAGAGYRSVLYLINVDKVAQKIAVPAEAGRSYRLHPVQDRAEAGDQRVREARYDKASGTFTVPARTAVVFVEGMSER